METSIPEHIDLLRVHLKEVLSITQDLTVAVTSGHLVLGSLVQDVEAQAVNIALAADKLQLILERLGHNDLYDDLSDFIVSEVNCPPSEMLHIDRGYLRRLCGATKICHLAISEKLEWQADKFAQDPVAARTETREYVELMLYVIVAQHTLLPPIDIKQPILDTFFCSQGRCYS
ncbi:hypothetical protein I6M49_22375 [Shewanella algae]|uniref:hypothetical protein n=1 Tax=Shewanella algae TaxID=38313 RepID=UPI001AAD6E5A|nr:hypothetical protein [Shewanella algae]MBO2656193.1 hypothetical protein [Shewanella algae]